MTAAVCTLFEKDYHHGVAALVNSLVHGGFDGTIYAGFRGPLPHWAQAARAAPLGAWRETRMLDVTERCRLAFIPLDTAAHFTNYKPQFMLQLFAAVNPDLLFYLDPDICIVQRWQFFEEWSACGVALCEDVNSPIGEHHPRRVGWRRHFGEHGMQLQFRSRDYVNGGCVGVARAAQPFLENWQRLTECMAQIIGGLDAAKIEGGASFRQKGFASCFDCSDQDALNAAVEMTGELSYSILPRAAMGFVDGAAVLPHALGPRKPWRRHYVREALSALPPGIADKAFWRSVDGPLRSMTESAIRRARYSLRIAAAIARFYRKSAAA